MILQKQLIYRHHCTSLLQPTAAHVRPEVRLHGSIQCVLETPEGMAATASLLWCKGDCVWELRSDCGFRSQVGEYRDGMVTGMLMTARNGHTACVEQLIAADANPNKAQTDDESTPLYGLRSRDEGPRGSCRAAARRYTSYNR